MQVDLLRARDNSLKNKITESLDKFQSLNLGVAYASIGAYNSLKKDFEVFLRKDGRIRALFDIEKFVTDPQIIQEFSTIGGDCECKVYLKTKTTKERGTYHPKFYLFFNDTEYNAIIGSSNFTLGGISNNIETNLCISGDHDAFFEALKEEFKGFWQSPNAINTLDHFDLLEEYKNLRKETRKENDKIEDRLDALKNQLDNTADIIIKSKKETLNENLAYLLGLVVANGRLDLSNRQINIYLKRGIANSGNENEGHYYNPDISYYKIKQSDAHSRDVERISEKLLDLLITFSPLDDITWSKIKDLSFRVTITFGKDSPLLAELLKYGFNTDNKEIVPRVPENILESNDIKMIKSFLKGYCDLKGRISASDGIYHSENNQKVFSSLRMGISVSHNHPEFMNDLMTLFHKIGINKGISATDPQKRTKELLIRIGVDHVPYDLLGTHWRRIFLKDFQFYLKSNRNRYDPNQLHLFS